MNTKAQGYGWNQIKYRVQSNSKAMFKLKLFEMQHRDSENNYVFIPQETTNRPHQDSIWQIELP